MYLSLLQVALLLLDHLPSTCLLNVTIFGNSFQELFPSAQTVNQHTKEAAATFIQVRMLYLVIVQLVSHYVKLLGIGQSLIT